MGNTAILSFLVHKHHSIPPQIGLLSLSHVLKVSVSGLSFCQIYSCVLRGFYADVNDITKFLSSVFWVLLMYRNIADFGILMFHPAFLLNSLFI